MNYDKLLPYLFKALCILGIEITTQKNYYEAVATLPLYLAGTFVSTKETLDVLNPFDGSVAATVSIAGTDEIEQATAAAVKAFEETKTMEPYQRKAVLDHIVARLKERHEECAEKLTLENGKTIKESRGEVTRAISTFELAAAETMQIDGEAFDGGITPAAAGRRVMVRKFPIGPVVGIAPFNFPLNLAVHKIAPAIAAGCPIVLKPASKTPLSCLLLSEIIDETEWPKGAFSCLPCTREAGQQLVEDDRFKLLTFTGSPAVGWKMKQDAGKKKVVLELGGNAGLIIDEDVSDWDRLITRAAIGSFYQCGQVCISVQHIFCHEAVYDEFKQRFADHTASLTTGNPASEETDIGPILDEKNRDRIQSWVDEALEKGATLVEGNESDGTMMRPTILENTDSECKIYQEEAFGPVVNIHKVKDVPEAVAKADDSAFGLQVGVFSNNFENIQYVYNHMDVGGVIVNDVPAFRVDHMPYGGIKDSGLGREGIAYAMADMLEEKAMVYFSDW